MEVNQASAAAVQGPQASSKERSGKGGGSGVTLCWHGSDSRQIPTGLKLMSPDPRISMHAQRFLSTPLSTDRMHVSDDWKLASTGKNVCASVCGKGERGREKETGRRKGGREKERSLKESMSHADHLQMPDYKT